MILGGMPSGVPPSVCLTQVDATQRQQVNRGVVSCSPELFPPVGPVNTRASGDLAMSFSQNEQTFSEENSEADSGFGQMSRPSSRSAETTNRKSVRYASLDDDGRVILFASSDSDVPDASENRIADSDMRSVSSENKSATSAKRKGADQTPKTRTSSRKQAASSERVRKERRASSSPSCRRDKKVNSHDRSPSTRSKQVKKREQKNDKVVLVNNTDDSSSE